MSIRPRNPRIPDRGCFVTIMAGMFTNHAGSRLQKIEAGVKSRIEVRIWRQVSTLDTRNVMC